jgi:hypothetical protein
MGPGQDALVRRRHRLLVAAGLLAPACSPAPAHRGAAPTTTSAEPGDPGTSGSAGPTSTALSESATTSITSPPSTEAPTTTLRVTTTSTVVLAPAVVLTVPLPEDEGENLADEEWWESQPGHEPATRDALLACIRSYEQGAAGYATDTGNGYYGAYQADQQTWNGIWRHHGRPDLVGTNPAHASPATQDQFAMHLLDERGLQPWPTPNRRCK